jgi:hypothetical protein
MELPVIDQITTILAVIASAAIGGCVLFLLLWILTMNDKPKRKEWVSPYKHAPCRSSWDNDDDCPDDNEPLADPGYMQRVGGYLSATHQIGPGSFGPRH